MKLKYLSPMALLRHCMLAAALSTWFHLGAQDQDSKGEVFDLSPFEVSAVGDRGYIASNTLAGGRLNTSLKDTPVSVQILTEQFFQDIGADDFSAASRYVLNTVTNGELGRSPAINDYTVQTRGLGAGFNTRNFFRWYANSDTAFTSRQEYARGPNSLVAGDAGVAGIPNIFSKQALRGSEFADLDMKLYSNGGYRVTLDGNYNIGEDMEVRGVLLRIDRSDYRDVSDWEQDGIFLTGTYRPWKGGSIRAEFEYNDRTFQISSNPKERWSNWDGVTFFDPTSGSALPAGTEKGPSRLIIAGTSNIQDFSSTAATNGTNRQLLVGKYMEYNPNPGLNGTDYPLLLDSWEKTLQAPNSYNNREFWQASIFINQKLGDNLFIEFAANRHEQTVDNWTIFFDEWRVDVNTKLPDGSANPHFGEFYADTTDLIVGQGNVVDAARLGAAYILELDSSSHRILAQVGWDDDDYGGLGSKFYIPDDGTKGSLQKAILIRRYASQGDVPTMPSGEAIRWAPFGFNTNRKELVYGQAAVSSSWLNSGKLKTLFGLRRDSLRQYVQETIERDPVTNSQIRAVGERLELKETVTSVSAGGVYDLSKGISLYVNYAEAFRPGTAALTIDNNVVQPITAEGREIGLKFALMDGRVAGQFGYYENESNGQLVRGPGDDINNVWTTLAAALPEDTLLDNQIPRGYNDVRDQEGTGFELELVANLTDNWQMFLNLAVGKAEISGGARDTKRWVDDNETAIEGYLAQLDPATQQDSIDSVNVSLGNVKSFIEANDTVGRELDDSYDYLINLFTKYTVSEGRLAGFFFGGGGNFRGERVIGNVPGDPFNLVKADSYFILNALLGYEFKIGGVDAVIQLNVDNVLDEFNVRPNGYSTYDGQFVPNVYTVQSPRSYSLSASLRF